MEVNSHLLGITEVFALMLLFILWRVRIGSHRTNGMFAPNPAGALPIIGHLHQLGDQNPIARTLSTMSDKHGPIFMIRLGMKRALVVNSYEAVKECFTAYDRVFATRPSSSQAKYLGYNNAAFGFGPYGTYWREMRKLAVLELLSSRRLGALKHFDLFIW